MLKLRNILDFGVGVGFMMGVPFLTMVVGGALAGVFGESFAESSPGLVMRWCILLASVASFWFAAKYHHRHQTLPQSYFVAEVMLSAILGPTLFIIGVLVVVMIGGGIG
jgi:hypothetical protein